MAVKRRLSQSNYGYPQGAVPSAPPAIVTDRNPTNADQGETGQLWINTVASSAFVNCGVTAGVTTWQTSPSGAGAEAALVVNPGDVTITAGNLVLGAGDATVPGLTTTGTLVTGTTAVVGTDLTVGGNSIFTGDVTINGSAIYNGDFDITSTDSLSFTTTANAVDAFAVLVNGGVLSAATLQNATGTAATSINLDSVAGGITLGAGTVLDANITGAVTVDTAAGISLDGLTASNFTVTGAGQDLSLISTGGSIVMTATEASATAIAINASAGASGLTIAAGTNGIGIAAADGVVAITSGTGAMNISADATANAVNLATGAGVKTLIAGSTNGASASTLQTGTGAMTFTAGGIFDANVTGAATLDATSISLDGTLASNFTVTGAAADLTLASVGGSLVLDASESAADAITITASGIAGGITLTSGTNPIVINSGANFDVNTATNTTIDSAIISLDGVAASNFTVTGAGQDLTLSSVGGSVVVNGSEASATAVHLDASDVAGGVTIESGTAGVLVTAPFIELNGIKIYTGAGAPAAALCTAVGDLYIRTDPSNANERLYIGTVIGTTWVHIAASA